MPHTCPLQNLAHDETFREQLIEEIAATITRQLDLDAIADRLTWSDVRADIADQIAGRVADRLGDTQA